MTPDQAFQTVRPLLDGQPVFLVGSAVAAKAHSNPNGFNDLDLFVPSPEVLVSTIQTLLHEGCTMNDRFSRVWYRWLRYGLKGWNTNSMQMQASNGLVLNIVYKLADKHPTTSLAQVIESFDFGLLAMGYDLESGEFRDMRSFLFPGLDPEGPLPLMPGKRANWVNGFISQYNGLREAARYAKYRSYGYDMSAVKADLLTGYRAASLYHSVSFDKEKQQLGLIYQILGDKIQNDAIPELVASYKTLDFTDSLDLIMEALD
jgi:hypothetical protein